MMLKKLLIIGSVIWLIFLSFVPRSVEVINKNPIFLLDQGRDYLAVRDIVVNHKLTLIGSELGGGMAGFQGVFHGPFHFYFLSIPFLLFNGDPHGGLLLMFLFGLLTIAMGFAFGTKVFGIFGGFVIAFLVALSPPLVAQSRFVWNPHPASLFILLAFYFIYLMWKGKNIYIFLAAFFSGFIYNFDTAIAVPMSIALLLYSVFLFRLKQFRKYSFIFWGFILSYLPFILFEVRHGFQAIKGFSSYLYSSQATFLKFDSFAYLHNFSDTFAKQNIFPETILIIIFISGLILFLSQEKRTQIKSFIIFLLILFVITITVSLFIKTHIFPYYLIHINFVYIFIFAYIFISSFITKNISLEILLSILLITFIISGTINGIDVMKGDLPDYGGMAKIKGKLEAIDYIYQNGKAKQEFGLLIFSPQVYAYPYDYLLWWYGTKKYGFAPSKDKTGIFYLLIEPDLSKPWSYKGWIETVVKTGKFIEEKELPSGFIIQKRIEEAK